LGKRGLPPSSTMPMKLRLAEEIEGDGNGTVLSEVINISNDAENSR
jgi:hypothetical protein